MQRQLNLLRWLPLAAILSILFFSFWLVQSPFFEQQPYLFSQALSFDLVVLIPFIYYLGIRKSDISWFSVLPVFVLSTLVARFMLPENETEFLHLLEFLIAPLELLIVFVLIRKVRRMRQAFNREQVSQQDFVESLRFCIQQELGSSKLTEFILTEVSMIYYAFGGWSKPKELPKTQVGFSTYKRVGYSTVVAVFLFVILLESLGVHLLIETYWSSLAAWVISILSLYGLVMLLGDYNAIRHRPIYIEGEKLHIRVGLRWALCLELTNIKSIETAFRLPDKKPKTLLNATVFGDPNILLNLKNPVSVSGMYGIQKEVDQIALSVDELDSFSAFFNRV